MRSSFRQGDQIKHTNHGRITGLPLEQLKLIQAAFRGEVVPKDSPQAFQTLNSREYGASYALLQLAKELELDRALYSRNEPWVQDCLAMIVGRVVYAGSKLALSNQWKNTALWELCGVDGPVDVEEHCYLPMDRLLERQRAIEHTLASKHLQNGHLVLYDITSTYFEGAYLESQIVLFGYNRDGKKGHEQVVLGLLCNAEGCPVGVEVFAGNTQDASTVVAKIQELRRDYGLKEVTFVGDRGMVTQANAEQLSQVEGLHTISALTHRQIVALVERKVIQAELSAQVGKILARYKMGKFVEWQIETGRLKWHFKEAHIEQEKLFDGCYIVSATVPKEQMNQDEVVETYKNLSVVEQAFRNLKTVSLEIRPVYHKKDDRIRSHVLLCVLAFYLQWHMQQRLKPLFEADGEGKNRQWTIENVIERLRAIRKQRVKVAGVEFDQVSQADQEQQKILDLMKVKL